MPERPSAKRIVILEPFYGGSHAAWLNGYKTFSQHQIIPLTLPAEYWQSRMLAGAVSLAEQFLQQLDPQKPPDFMLGTDMLDLATFKALVGAAGLGIPTGLYFHENQLTYPSSPRIRYKRELAAINYTSYLMADRVYFNSAFHQQNFMAAMKRFAVRLSGYSPNDADRWTKNKPVRVLPVGVDLRRLDAYRTPREEDSPPLILWNHRWEPDKNPEAFFEALYMLADEGISYRVALLGENPNRSRTIFHEARERLGERVIHFGYADFPVYARLLWQADVVVSTAYQEFFGISVVEAIYCGAYPVLPHRLSYPELLPEREPFLYKEDAFLPMLRRVLLERPTAPPSLAESMKRYDWSVMAPQYDSAFFEEV